MDVKFTIPDEILQTTIKETVMRQVNAIVDNQVRTQMGRYKGAIERAVDEHLSKRVTDLEVKGLIDKALVERIKTLGGESDT